MKLHGMSTNRRNIWMGVALLSIASRVEALTQAYCSTQNTGSDFAVVNDIWQSNGACHDTCNGQGYAFAIVQYQDCWCSNYAPADQVSVTDYCNVNCPGYPYEQCGDKDTGYYGYVAIGPAASGTVGAAGASTSSSSSTSTEPSSTYEDPVTSYASTADEVTTPSPTPTTSTRQSTSNPPTTDAPATPVTSVIVQTVSGSVVTQTVTSTPIVAAGSDGDSIPAIQRKNGTSPGTIAGIVVGIVGGAALLGAAAFFLWRRRRQNSDPENPGGSQNGSKKNMTRNTSVLSKSGLLNRTNRAPSMTERDHDDYYASGAGGSNSVRHSMMFGLGEGVSPTSPLDSSHSGDSRRLSKPMVYDQRLNPSALFANQEANGSRISMQDQQDYSRPLGVMNPDIRASFESRLSHVVP